MPGNTGPAAAATALPAAVPSPPADTSNWNAAYPPNWPLPQLTVPAGCTPFPHPFRDWPDVKVVGKHGVDFSFKPEAGGVPYLDGLWEITFQAPASVDWDKLAAHVDGQLAAQGFWLAQAYPIHAAYHVVDYEPGEHSNWASRLYYSADGLTCACVTYLDHHYNNNEDDHTKREDLSFKGYVLGVAHFHQAWLETLREAVAYRCELERQGAIPPGYLAPTATALPAVRDKYAELADLRTNAPAQVPTDWPVPELTLPAGARQRLLMGEIADKLEREHVADPEQEHADFHAVEEGRQPFVYHEHQLFTHLTAYTNVPPHAPGDPAPAGTWVASFWVEGGAHAALVDAKTKLTAAGYQQKKSDYTEPDKPNSHYEGGKGEEGQVWYFDGPDRRTSVTIEHYILQPEPYTSAPMFTRWVSGLWPHIEVMTYTVARARELTRPPLIGP